MIEKICNRFNGKYRYIINQKNIRVKKNVRFSADKVGKEEIDFIGLLILLWGGRKKVALITLIFVFIGLFIAVFSSKEYTSSTTMVPQISSPTAGLGSLSSLASIAGFNLNMSTQGTEISPILYPKIIASTSFQLEIMNADYIFPELDHKVSLLEYYKDYYKPGLFESIAKYTFGLPGLLKDKFSNSGEDNYTINSLDSTTIRLSREQNSLRNILSQNLTLDVNEKDGYLVLKSRFHQADVSAQIAKKAQQLLQEYITDFKIEKAYAKYTFILERYEEKKKDFTELQLKLAKFRDENKNISSAIIKTEEQRLESEFQLAFEVYSELAKQLEQARIKIKEDTPVFSVIQEVEVPVEKSKPNRPLILVVWTLIGILFGFGWYLGNIYFLRLQKAWKVNNES